MNSINHQWHPSIFHQGHFLFSPLIFFILHLHFPVVCGFFSVWFHVFSVHFVCRASVLCACCDPPPVHRVRLRGLSFFLRGRYPKCCSFKLCLDGRTFLRPIKGNLQTEINKKTKTKTKWRGILNGWKSPDNEGHWFGHLIGEI